MTVVLRVRPRGGRDAIGGIVEDGDGRAMLVVRLAATPVEGAANRALVALLARALDVRKRDVTILSGETGRMKRVRIAGAPAPLIARLRALALD